VAQQYVSNGDNRLSRWRFPQSTIYHRRLIRGKGKTMWNRAIIWVLCIAVVESILCADAYAVLPNQPKPTHLTKVVEKLGTGTDALVALRLQDKSVVSGYLAHAGPESFTVIDNATGEERTVAYIEVNRLEGVNVSTGVRVHHGGGFRAGVARGMAMVIPGRHVQSNSFIGGKALIIGIVIGILIAVIVAKET
jgi:hypothetical protein